MSKLLAWTGQILVTLPETSGKHNQKSKCIFSNLRYSIACSTNYFPLQQEGRYGHRKNALPSRCKHRCIQPSPASPILPHYWKDTVPLPFIKLIRKNDAAKVCCMFIPSTGNHVLWNSLAMPVQTIFCGLKLITVILCASMAKTGVWFCPQNRAHLSNQI